MERGFYHPDRGYWQTISDPDAETLAEYPAGTIEVPLKPGADHEWIDGAWVHVPPDPAIALESERAAMVCSRFQAKAAMLHAGILDDVEAMIAGSDAVTRLAWAEAVEFRRNSPTILTLAAALNLSDAEIDGLFRSAMQNEA